MCVICVSVYRNDSLRTTACLQATKGDTEKYFKETLWFVRDEVILEVGLKHVIVIGFNELKNIPEIKSKQNTYCGDGCVLYTNIDQKLVNSLHGLLNCEMGGLDCHVITTEFRTSVHCIHMSHLFCNALVHVV